jgi:hypothetical protein
MTATVKNRDAFKAGYTITPVSNSNDSTAPDIFKHNIRLTRSNVSYSTLHRNCLVSVNGFYHITDTDNINGVMVFDAMKSLKHSKQNQIGITSFKDIAEISLHPFKREMLTLNNDGTVRVNLPFDTTNKTVMFSIAGYLNYQNDLNFFMVGDNLFKLDFNNMSLLDRYFECKKYIDLSSLPLEFSPNNQNQISLEQLLSDENLIALMLLSQSFIVVLDTPSIVVNKQYVKKTGLPGMYIYYKEPIYPLVVGYGRHAEYWSFIEDGHYAVNVLDNVVENRIYTTTLINDLTSADNSRRPDSPDQYSDAYFIEIKKA